VPGRKRSGNNLLQPVAVYLYGKPMEVGRRPFEAPFTLPDCAGHGTHKAEAAQ